MSSNGKRKSSLKSKLAIGAGTGLIVVFGGAGIVGTKVGDVINGKNLGTTPEESAAICEAKYPDNAELWPGCTTERTRSFARASEIHTKIRFYSSFGMAGSIALLFAGIAGVRRKDENTPTVPKP